MKRTKKLTWKMKVALDKKGYDPKECRFVEEDNVAWLFERTQIAENGEAIKETFWLTK